MALADEKVISGDYAGLSCLLIDGNVIIRNGTDTKGIKLTKETVKRYEVLDSKVGKSTSSCIIRIIVGMVIVGLIQLLLARVANILSISISSISLYLLYFFDIVVFIVAIVGAEWNGVYVVAIEFLDGKRSLIEIAEKSYKQLIKDIF